MLFDQVTDTQMQAARLFGGAAMAAFVAAPLFRHRAPAIRIIVAVAYFAGVLSFTVYLLT
jgi:hypothetical protein